MIAALFFVAAPALAPFTVAFTAPFHGAPCTQFAGWESFTLANNQANAPDAATPRDRGGGVGRPPPGGVPPAAGTLDNLTIPPVYRVTDSVPSDLQEVVLQVAVLLNPMNWSSFTLTYVDTAGTPHTLGPTTSTYLVHAMGHDERVITWDLTAVSDVVLAYQIDFGATNSFTTLDAVKLDARFSCTPGVPFCTPGTAGVIGCPCSNPPAGPDRRCDNTAPPADAHTVPSAPARL